MKQVCLLITLVLLSNGVLGRSYRYKRQSSQDVTGPTTVTTSETTTVSITESSTDPSVLSTITTTTSVTTTGPTTVPTSGQTIDTAPTTARDQVSTTTTTNPTTDQNTIRNCIRNCPVTSEYNPVCGTDGVTYTNPSRLFCAQACGNSVSLLRSSRCPPAPQPAS